MYTVPGDANVRYQSGSYAMRHLKSIWRRKWLVIVMLAVLSTSAVFILTRGLVYSSEPSVQPDTYMDDVPDELYQGVLRRWYNATVNSSKWYNSDNISMWNPALLDELRKNWIIWKANSSAPYVLQEPDVEDQSMGQAQVIREVFNNKRNGFFVECGAYDGETRSNTLALERFYGWTGILIEADPINFTKMLLKNRRAYLSPTCVSIRSHPMAASFLMARNIGRLHEPRNSSEPNTADVANSGIHVNVQCFPFASYVAALNVKTVDYFSLDIEGNEIEVLETIPFDKLDIKALSVEHSHTAKGRKYMIDLMEKYGYYVYSFVERSDNLANDVIFVKR